MINKKDDIMNDLNILDSSLHEDREEMGRMIDELILHKPVSKIDPLFEKKLRRKIAEKIKMIKRTDAERSRPAVFFLAHKRRIGIAAAIAAAAVPAVLFFSSPGRETVPVAYLGKPGDIYSTDAREYSGMASPMKDVSSKQKYTGPGAGSMRSKSEPAAVMSYGKPGERDYSPGKPLGDGKIAYRMEREEIAVSGSRILMKNEMALKEKKKSADADDAVDAEGRNKADALSGDFNTEQYSAIYENEFLKAGDNPLSTFSIDVDTASYSNMRRFLNSGILPPSDSIRIEELINYFTYDYPLPEKGLPFSVTTEAGKAPWNKGNILVRIALKGMEIPAKELPPSNLVFLIDVSGSMVSENKLGLIKKSFAMLVKELTPDSRIAIVVYAGATGLVLPSTPGSDREAIFNAINRLQAGGPTAGSAGITLAYKVAMDNFIKGGNNRIILATDGDFNIGQSSDAELVRLIEEKRGTGIFLTVLGFGMGNYKDSKLEMLADKGNGNYAYIDSIQEAEKVMSHDIRSTLFTIAKDVKIQVEFNPALVESYRLIGYENRIMKKEDFNDDKKDAGEMGSGHTVTAFYEIVPAGNSKKGTAHEPLKYQGSSIKEEAYRSNELMTIKLRYKDPNGGTSRLITRGIPNIINTGLSRDFTFASAVAEFGMILRNSKYRGTAGYRQVMNLAGMSMGQDRHGYRAEFLKLVKKARELDKRNQ